MIDCLSSQCWLNPQIDFLLFLQNIRISHFEAFNKLFLSITILGELWLPTLICAITYWCIDLRAGVYLFSLASCNAIITHFAKMLACVYRPWVLSDKMCPVSEAVAFAKGYSFPSGHTAMSSSVLGGIAFLQRHKIFRCLSIIFLILLVGFSRLWMGVHTPQDVVFGLLTGLTLVFVMDALINWAEKDKNRYLYLLCLINAFAVFALVFVCYFNSYRMDYVNGKLLVDPIRQIYTMVVCSGLALGLINGAFVCRVFFPFNPKNGSKKVRILRGLIGGTLLVCVMRGILQPIFFNMIDFKFAIIYAIIIGLTITLVYPLIFTKVESFLLNSAIQ